MGLDFGVARRDAEWHQEPNYRGTYGLLSSCLITMVLCVWTAVHLNLPEHKKAKTQRWRKVWWLIIGLFAPELVAWAAFEQNKEARALCRKMKEVLGEEVTRPFLVEVWSWTCNIKLWRTHKPSPDPEINLESPISLLWGGFAFDTTITKQKFLPKGRERITLTSLGVLRLATVAGHLLPNLSISQIQDKSKANSLAKTIVCLQASWFIAQCISRMAYGLSISLLELNTFAHAICAIFAYFLWWDKPFDVEEPALIEGPDLAIVCAGMCMRSSIGANCTGEGFFPGDRIVARFWYKEDGLMENTNRTEFGLMESLIAHTPSDRPIYAAITPRGEETMDLSNAGKPITNQLPLSSRKQTTLASKVSTKEHVCRLYMGQSIFDFGFRRGHYHNFNTPPFKSTSFGRAFTQINRASYKIVAKKGFLDFQRPFIELTSGDMLRLRLARECYQKYPSFVYYPDYKYYGKSYIKHPNQTQEIWLNEYVVSRAHNWPFYEGGCKGFSDNHPFFDSLPLFVSLFVIGVVYGGLHLLAWNPPVLSHTQTLMWRISGVTLVTYSALPIPGIGIISVYLIITDKLKDIAKKVPNWIYITTHFVAATAVLLFYVVIVGGGLLYVFSRVYLLIECVISIPYLPDSVYQATNWSQYFPHI